jgi:hypothetical protein
MFFLKKQISYRWKKLFFHLRVVSKIDRVKIHIDIVKIIISTTILPYTKFSIVIKKSEFLI